MRVVKATLKALLISGIIVALIWVIGSCIGNQIKKSTIKQLRYNLNDKKAECEELERQVEELQTQLSNKTLEADTANQKQAEATVGGSLLYLQAKFPSDGNYYVDANESTFYKDSTCTQVVDNPRFMSPNIDENLEASNGFPVKGLRLDNGDIVYCPRDTGVYLVTEKEWQEYQK